MRLRLIAAIAAATGMALAGLPGVVAADAAAAKPSVRSVSPRRGPTAGGTRVKVTGTHFTHVRTVRFGTTRGASVKVVSTSTLYVTAPRHAAGTVHLVVTTGAGSSRAVTADRFTFVAPPTISSVSPVRGGLAGGTRVTVRGKNFLDVRSVRFGSTAGRSLKVSSAGALTVTAPVHPAGQLDIRVITKYGTSKAVSADHFRYVDAPVVTSLSPACWTGGTVTASGKNFYDVTDVSMLQDPSSLAEPFHVLSATSLTIDVPEGDVDDVAAVVVTTKYGDTSDAPVSFTYVDSTSITDVSPNAGSTDGGTSVTLTVNRSLVPPVQVLMAGEAIPITGFTDHQITLDMPAHDAGPVALKVLDATNCKGGSPGTYTYDPPTP
jgi:hypothetical protein